MRLKTILKESKQLERLEDEINSGKWLVKDPFLYRGRSEFEGKIDIKHTSEGGRVMDWEFPDERITKFFSDVENNCYPEYPKHRNSRHCTTSLNYASNFGDEVYAVFPSKNAKVAYFRDPDTVVNLFTGEYFLDSLRDIYEEREKIFKKSREVWVDLYEYFIENKNVNLLQKHGCLEGLKTKTRKSRGRLYANEDTFDLKSQIKWASDSIKRVWKFFEADFQNKYPPSASDWGDEVLVEGNIMKVHVDLLEKYKSQKSNET